ncbi:MAG: GGDEF domain-containing protein, partial [Planctomycetota bacterium]
NRRRFDACLQAHFARCRAGDEPFSVLLLDADHFKRVNDGFGHAAGDALLMRVADCLRAEAGGAREVFRIGGEEFALLMPGEGSDAAVFAYRRLAAGIGRPIEFASGTVELGMSGGVAMMQGSDADAGALLLRADEALYAAKAAGRRQVVVSPGRLRA